jgi:hypothetical protein
MVLRHIELRYVTVLMRSCHREFSIQSEQEFNRRPMKTALEQHAALLQELAEALYRDVSEADSAWTSAYFDFRLDTPGCGLDRTI